MKSKLSEIEGNEFLYRLEYWRIISKSFEIENTYICRNLQNGRIDAISGNALVAEEV